MSSIYFKWKFSYNLFHQAFCLSYFFCGVGAVFSESLQADYETAFRLAIDTINNDRSILPNTELKVVVNKSASLNAFRNIEMGKLSTLNIFNKLLWSIQKQSRLISINSNKDKKAQLVLQQAKQSVNSKHLVCAIIEVVQRSLPSESRYNYKYYPYLTLLPLCCSSIFNWVRSGSHCGPDDVNRSEIYSALLRRLQRPTAGASGHRSNIFIHAG